MSYNLNTQCCGMHEVCEKESLRAAQEDIEYYEDEELDRFRGRTAYSEEEVEEFREVLYTMRTDEVPGWLFLNQATWSTSADIRVTSSLPS